MRDRHGHASAPPAQSLHPVLGEVLDQDDRIGTTVDESKFPRTTRDENGITLTDVEDYGPRIGQGRLRRQHQNGDAGSTEEGQNAPQLRLEQVQSTRPQGRSRAPTNRPGAEPRRSGRSQGQRLPAPPPGRTSGAGPDDAQHTEDGGGSDQRGGQEIGQWGEKGDQPEMDHEQWSHERPVPRYSRQGLEPPSRRRWATWCRR